MDNRSPLTFFALLLCFNWAQPIYSLEAIDRIELRNSYDSFSKRMAQAGNDITACLCEFRRTVDVHKRLLKKEPDNADVQKQLLILVNSLFDIADTFLSSANQTINTKPSKAAVYFGKAAICYKELENLYPDNLEFKQKVNSSKVGEARAICKNAIADVDLNFNNYEQLLTRFSTAFNHYRKLHEASSADETISNDIHSVKLKILDRLTSDFSASISILAPDSFLKAYSIGTFIKSLGDSTTDPMVIASANSVRKKLIGCYEHFLAKFNSDFEAANIEYSSANKNIPKLSLLLKAAISSYQMIPSISIQDEYLSEHLLLILKTNNIINNYNLCIHRFNECESAKEFLQAYRNGKAAYDLEDYSEAVSNLSKAIDASKIAIDLVKQSDVSNAIKMHNKSKEIIQKRQRKIVDEVEKDYSPSEGIQVNIYSCSHCGLTVEARTMPRGTPCPARKLAPHDWRYLGRK